MGRPPSVELHPFGQAVQDLINQAKRTRTKLALESGLNPGEITEICQGVPRRFTRNYILKIIEGLIHLDLVEDVKEANYLLKKACLCFDPMKQRYIYVDKPEFKELDEDNGR